MRQRCPLQCSPYSTLINHLILIFQQEFSLSWGYKNWLLICKNRWLSLVCQGLSVLCAGNSHFISVLDQLTPFCNALCLEILFHPCSHCLNTSWSLPQAYRTGNVGRGGTSSTPVSTSLPGGRWGWACPLENLQEAKQPIIHDWWWRSLCLSLRILLYGMF